jgi:hypothetical protein
MSFTKEYLMEVGGYGESGATEQEQGARRFEGAAKEGKD